MEQEKKTYSDNFLRTLFTLTIELVTTLSRLETAFRHFHPPIISDLQKEIIPSVESLNHARNKLNEIKETNGLERFLSQLNTAVDFASNSLKLFTTPAEPDQVITQIMRSMRQHQRAQEALYPMCRMLGPVSQYFLEAPARNQSEKYDLDPIQGIDVGLFTEKDSLLDTGASYSLYIPETYDGSRDLPLVVALHGGYGNGRDFIWVWLREARTRGFILLAPSSIGTTWSFGTGDDEIAIDKAMNYIFNKWRVDKNRILLTGISDGATYSLYCGLMKNSPFTALAPISGVLLPIDLSNAEKKRIYLVHGTLDWMFPVQRAFQAYDALKKAGADITFREIKDLSHTYPREENNLILSWFDPSLSL